MLKKENQKRIKKKEKELRSIRNEIEVWKFINKKRNKREREKE